MVSDPFRTVRPWACQCGERFATQAKLKAHKQRCEKGSK